MRERAETKSMSQSRSEKTRKRERGRWRSERDGEMCVSVCETEWRQD